MSGMTLLTLEQVAERLQISRSTIYRLIRSGRLHASKPCGHWRVDEEDIAKLLDNQPAKPAARIQMADAQRQLALLRANRIRPRIPQEAAQ